MHVTSNTALSKEKENKKVQEAVFQTAAGGVHSLRNWDRRKMSARVATYVWVRLPSAILQTVR